VFPFDNLLHSNPAKSPNTTAFSPNKLMKFWSLFSGQSLKAVQLKNGWIDYELFVESTVKLPNNDCLLQ